MAHPADLGVGGDQRDGARGGEHRQPLDRDRSATSQPIAAFFDQERECGGDLLGVVDPVGRQGVTLADLDAEIRPVQAAERFFVGDVVAEEDRGAGTGLVAQDVERLSLVGDDDGEFDHRLAFGDLDAFPGGRSDPDAVQGCVAVGGRGVPEMQHGARRLRLHRHVLVVGGDRPQFDDQCVEELGGGRGDLVDEPDVELTAVAAHQVHFGGQPGQGGEVAQRATGDDGRGGRIEFGESAHRPHRIAVGPGIFWAGHDGRHAAVVVRGDQQPGHTCDCFEGAPQFRDEVLCTHYASLRPSTPAASNQRRPVGRIDVFVTVRQAGRAGPAAARVAGQTTSRLRFPLGIVSVSAPSAPRKLFAQRCTSWVRTCRRSARIRRLPSSGSCSRAARMASLTPSVS